jgi:hypothetical protein
MDGRGSVQHDQVVATAVDGRPFLVHRSLIVFS